MLPFQAVRPDTVRILVERSSRLSELWIGVVGGIATAVVLWILTKAWQSHIEPWFESKVYRGLSLDGTWKLVDEAGLDGAYAWPDHETLQLTQRAHRLHGTITLVSRDSPPVIRTYAVTGEIQERHTWLSYGSKDRNALAYGTLLLHANPSGDELSGYTLYLDQTDRLEVPKTVKYSLQQAR